MERKIYVLFMIGVREGVGESNLRRPFATCIHVYLSSCYPIGVLFLKLKFACAFHPRVKELLIIIQDHVISTKKHGIVIKQLAAHFPFALRRSS